MKVHVLCSGIRYGRGEGVFYDHFKNAWIQSPAQLPIIGDGKNLIPTIHIVDLARVTKKIINHNIEKSYIFAVDKTTRPSQKRIVKSVSNGIGTGQWKNFEPKEISNSILWKEFLMINLKMKTSDVFKDLEPPASEEEPTEEDLAKLKFPWHCEKGIVENAKPLNIEFNKARDLQPVKIFIAGPPASGKTYYSNKIMKYYNIPRVHVKELTDKALELGKVEPDEEKIKDEKELAQAREIFEKLGAIRDELHEKLTAENEAKEWPEGEEAPEIDKDSLSIRVPDDIIYKLMSNRLNENDCRNRGYILDGYPRSYDDNQNIFLKKPVKYDEEGQVIEEEEEELEEGKKKSFAGYLEIDEIIPKSCIVLKQDDKFLMDRVKNLSEDEIANSHYNGNDMKRRLKKYRDVNESKVAEPSVMQFFREHNIQLFQKDAGCPEDTIFNSFKIYIERVSKLLISKNYIIIFIDWKAK